MGARRTRIGLILGATILCAPLLSGCTNFRDGASGITVDSQGRLLGIVRSCDGAVFGAELYSVEVQPPNNRIDAGNWQHTSPGLLEESFRLSDDPGPGWTATQLTSRLTKYRRYYFIGYSQDLKIYSQSVSFRLADVSDLKPGQIFSDYFVKGKRVHGPLSHAEFVAHACPK